MNRVHFNFRRLALTAMLFALPLLGGEEEVSPTRFEEITTTDGRTFRNCTIKSRDPEGIVVQHEGGLARVSLFDLTPELQRAFDFDPVRAMKAYRENAERQRELRKQQVLETERQRAEQERADAAAEMQAIAVKEWLPIEARIVRVTPDGAFAEARQIAFLPTTTVSALGFEGPGPPKRVTRPFGSGLVFLKGIQVKFQPDETWQGFLEPISIRSRPHPFDAGKTVPVHLAVTPP